MTGYNLPPGVTGFEDAINGPTREYDATFDVKHECDEDTYDAFFEGSAAGTVVLWSSPPAQFVFDCPQCGEEVTLESDDGDNWR